MTKNIVKKERGSKETVIAVRVSPGFKRQVIEAARADDRKVPDWVRRAMKEKLGK